MSDDEVPRSIARVLDVFEAVLERQRCTLSEAAAAVDLTPTTALRYLRALEVRGYLRRDDAGVFSAGPGLGTLTKATETDRSLDRVIATALPHLERLTRDTGESTYLALRGDEVATYVAVAESDRAIRHVGWVGQEVALNATAVGAALDEPGTVAVRQGAVEPDISAMSLALRPIGDLRVAVSIIGPSHRMDQTAIDTFTPALRGAVASIEEELGVANSPIPHRKALLR